MLLMKESLAPRKWRYRITQISDMKTEMTKHIFVKSDIVSGVTIPGAYLEIWEILVDEHGNLRKQADGSWMLAGETVCQLGVKGSRGRTALFL